MVNIQLPLHPPGSSAHAAQRGTTEIVVVVVAARARGATTTLWAHIHWRWFSVDARRGGGEETHSAPSPLDYGFVLHQVGTAQHLDGSLQGHTSHFTVKQNAAGTENESEDDAVRCCAGVSNEK